MRLFLGNLDHTAEESTLREWLEKWGLTIMSLTFIRPETGGPYAFCNVPKEQGATAIRMLTGKAFAGKVIAIREAVGR